MKKCIAMKKSLIVATAVILMVLVMGASTLTTRISSYRVLDTLTDASSAVDSDLAAASGYGTSAITGEVDLLKTSGAGSDTYANAIVVTLNATGAADGDTLTQKIYGRVDSGPPQLVISIVWTIGTARADGATATFLWADTAVVTSTHLIEIKTADNAGGDRVASVMLDFTGYRYAKSLITGQTGDPVLITSNYRIY